ncbi:hypothetical protein K7432_001158 [Basidiobolus ranarum]|uniref:Solute carrier family 40 member n=1 Tax=Basidiobolus ranarum TaxID=34480 RepID=A0ABR2WA31_9FUNG
MNKTDPLLRDDSSTQHSTEEAQPFGKGRLYTSHFLNVWGDRLYEFASFLFIMEVFQDTLLPSSLFGFLVTFSAIVCGGMIGNWVDRSDRLRVVRTSIILQKLSIALSSVCFYLLFTRFHPRSLDKSTQYWSYGIFSIILVLGMVLKVMLMASNISIEKDWVVIIANKDEQLLTQLNTSMRRIDLICKLVAPLLVACLTTVGTTIFAVIFIGIWNIISLVLEYALIYRVYQMVPALSLSKGNQARFSTCENTEEEALLNTNVFKPTYEAIPGNPVQAVAQPSYLRQVFDDWIFYFKHPIFLPSLSIAMLYLTVLSFNGIMISFLKWQGYSDSLLASMKAISAFTGVLATYLMPVVAKHIGVVRTGIWSIWSEVITLIPVVAAFLCPPTILAKTMLFGGMALSRIGLWSFDLSQVHIIQSSVANEDAGRINGLQHSLCNLFDLAQFGLTMIFYNPEDFIIPVVTSFVMVLLAALTFSFYTYQQRGHLFHLDKFTPCRFTIHNHHDD